MTGSVSRGRCASAHNTRDAYRSGGEIDPAKLPNNIRLEDVERDVVLVNRPLREVYEERFGTAVEAYNAAQVEKGHPERRIADYLEHVRGSKNKLEDAYEYVVQIGGEDESGNTTMPTDEQARGVYESFLRRFEARCGSNFAVVQSIIHFDERTPHMHLQVVPVAESSRGVKVQNSLNKAVKQAGFDDWAAMMDCWRDELLAGAMSEHGIEKVDALGQKREHMTVEDFKAMKRMQEMERDLRKEITDMQQAKEYLHQETRQLEEEIKELGEQSNDVTVGQSVQDLGMVASGRGLGERESAARAANRELRDRVEGLERDVADRKRAIGAVREQRAEVDGRTDRLRERIAACRGRIESVLGHLGGAVRIRLSTGQEHLEQLLTYLGVLVESEQPPQPVVMQIPKRERSAATLESDYDLASISRDARGAAPVINQEHTRRSSRDDYNR